jgi:hypothetical protein
VFACLSWAEYRDSVVAVVTPIDTQTSYGFTSAPPRLFCKGKGMLSTATVDSQLIVFVTTSIRLQECPKSNRWGRRKWWECASLNRVLCGKLGLNWIGLIKTPSPPRSKVRALPNSFGPPRSLARNYFSLLARTTVWLTPLHSGPSGETGVWWVLCLWHWSHKNGCTGSPKWMSKYNVYCHLIVWVRAQITVWRYNWCVLPNHTNCILL